MPTVHDRRRALISELEALGDAGRVLAKELADLYRAREMAGLNRDMYDAAAGVGKPDAGWTRGSENLALLRERFPDPELGEKEWLELLRPRESDRKSTRLNSSHVKISYAVFCLKKKIIDNILPLNNASAPGYRAV